VSKNNDDGDVQRRSMRCDAVRQSSSRFLVVARGAQNLALPHTPPPVLFFAFATGSGSFNFVIVVMKFFFFFSFFFFFEGPQGRRPVEGGKKGERKLHKNQDSQIVQ
jgi:hypothetical protein